MFRHSLLITSASACVVAMSLYAVPLNAAWLPDLERGTAAMEAGDFAEAERNLRPLAQRSIVEAQVRLARLYAQRGQGSDLKQAIHWYWTALPSDRSVRLALVRAILADGSANSQTIELLREADDDGDPEALRMRLRLYRDMPALAPREEALALAKRAAASEQIDDATAAISWYGSQPEDAGIQAAVVALCERWEERIDECYGISARQLRAAGEAKALAALIRRVETGQQQNRIRNEAVIHVARSLTATELVGEARPAEAYRLLKRIATRSPEAKTRMARLLIDDPALDESLTAHQLLEEALADGWDEAGLYLGRLHLELQSPDSDPARAVDLLERAAERFPAAHFYLGRIYDDGYLGLADKTLALREYLQAARGGYVKADLALARLYWENRGAIVDPVNAYCFARIAMHSGVPGGKEMVALLHERVEPELIERGQRKAEQEYRARQQVLGAAQVTPRLQAQLSESSP